MLILICFFTSSYLFAQTTPERFDRVKIPINDTQTLPFLASLGIAIDHFDTSDNLDNITVELSESELSILQQNKVLYSTLIKNVSEYYEKTAKLDMLNLQNNTKKNEALSSLGCNVPAYSQPKYFSLGSMGGYFTYTEFLNKLDSMALLFPNLITIKQPISNTLTTFEGRPIYWLKISDNPNIDEDEPEVLYNAVHHAREPLSLSQLIFFMYYLLENYETDINIKNLINNTELYFIPCVNPDGYVYNQTTNPNGGGMWRKNRRNNGDGTFGVDNNRNYGYNWGIDNVGSSAVTNSSTYRGTAPFSEPENQLVRDFCLAHHFEMCLNYHTYGNSLIYPWGYIANLYTPDHATYTTLCERLTWYNRFLYGTTNQTVNYITNGDSDDWMYGEQTLKNKILALTPEVTKYSDGGFWAPPSLIIQYCKQTLWQNLQTAYISGNYAVATDNTPNFNSLNGNIILSIQRLGLSGSGSFTISVEPISDNINSISSSQTISNVDILSYLDLTFSIALKNTIKNGDSLAYAILINNGNFTITDTIKKNYNPDVIWSDAANDLSQWQSNNWAINTLKSKSGGVSICESPQGDYPASATYDITTKNAINLSGCSHATLSFWATWDIQPYYDYIQLLASNNNGTTWTPLCGNFTKLGTSSQVENEPLYDGYQPEWVQEEVSLDAYAGQSILLKFVLKTNSNANADGFYFDDISITRKKLYVPVKAYLQGTYNPTGNIMAAMLRASLLLPLQQPFNTPPWNYKGAEVVNNFSNIPLNTVDWVLLELRAATDINTVVDTVAAFLLSNGNIVDIHNSAKGVFFKRADKNNSYYISIKSRNHLAVVSSNTIALNNNPSYDFTTSASKALGNNQLAVLEPNVYGLYAADCNANGIISLSDFNLFKLNLSLINTYNSADFNLDGSINIADFNFFINNATKLSLPFLRY